MEASFGSFFIFKILLIFDFFFDFFSLRFFLIFPSVELLFFFGRFLNVFLTSTDLYTFLVSAVVHFFQHLFSCEHRTHCISPSRLGHKSTLYIGHICCVLFLIMVAEHSLSC